MYTKFKKDLRGILLGYVIYYYSVYCIWLNLSPRLSVEYKYYLDFRG